MKLDKFKLKKGLKILLFSVLLFFMIGFAEKKHQEKICRGISVNIDNQYDNYFINRNDILKLVTNGGFDKIVGSNLAELKLKPLENRVRAHKYIQEAEVYRDLGGNLIVHAVQSKPIARVIQQNGPDAYIGENGQILPTSTRFTARVMVIDGQYANKLVKRDLNQSPESKEIFKLLKFIRNDAFWKAQIAQLSINEKGDITMYTQVSKQYVEFGKAEDIKTKFDKLKIFYTKILPRKGWNTYEKVNLKYKDQIVCE